MTIQSLRRLGKLWEKRLNLGDWKIGYSLVDNMPDKSDAVGMASWFAPDRTACVLIHKDQGNYTHEETLVHELLHIVIEGHTSDESRDDVNIERALNAVAKALYTAYRGKKRRAD